MQKIRELQKEDVKVITKMMLEFPNAYGEDYVKSMAMVAIERFLRRRDIDPLFGAPEQQLKDKMKQICQANGFEPNPLELN